MPLVNVIRGDRIAPAPINVRTPFVRVPMWLALTWWTVNRLMICGPRTRAGSRIPTASWWPLVGSGTPMPA